MTAITIPPFTTQLKMERLLSPIGIAGFSDHDQTGTPDDDVVDDCIEQATHEIASQLYRRYDPAELPDSKLVQHWATVLACYYLCERRGNSPPASLANEATAIMSDKGLLNKVATGVNTLPDIRSRGGNVPAFSNLSIDRRFRRSAIRVVEQCSSDEPTQLSRDNSLDWLVGP